MNVLEWRSQNLDLNPNENLFKILKLRVMERKSKNLTQLEHYCLKE